MFDKEIEPMLYEIELVEEDSYGGFQAKGSVVEKEEEPSFGLYWSSSSG